MRIGDCLRGLAVAAVTVGLLPACGAPPRQIVLPEASKLAVSDGRENDHFGAACALYGNRAVVGAVGADDRGPQAGAAYILVRAGDVWQQEGKLLARDGGKGDAFGTAVHLDGDRVVVGSRGNAANGRQSGSAYVFLRRDGGWREEQKLFSTGRSRDDRFGWAVCMSGGLAAVGAEGDDQLGPMSGVAYIYRYAGARWEVDAVLRAPDSAPFDYFGSAVYVDGDRAAVGARGDDDEGKNSGSVYVYRRTEAGWDLAQKLSPADGCRDGAFGSAVCLSGNRLMVGAYGDDDRGKRSGAAYVYAWDGRRWMLEQKLTAPDGRATDQFGRAIGLSGDRAIVGAHGDQVKGKRRAGSAYVFQRVRGRWAVTGKLIADRVTGQANLGRSVAIEGGAVMVGAPGDGTRGPWAGAVYLLTGE